MPVIEAFLPTIWFFLGLCFLCWQIWTLQYLMPGNKLKALLPEAEKIVNSLLVLEPPRNPDYGQIRVSVPGSSESIKADRINKARYKRELPQTIEAKDTLLTLSKRLSRLGIHSPKISFPMAREAYSEWVEYIPRLLPLIRIGLCREARNLGREYLPEKRA